MRLVAKFSLIIVVSLMISGISSFFVFYRVLKPEFQRQREESWSYRAEQLVLKIETLLNQTSVIGQIIRQPLSKVTELEGPLSTLIGTSKIESIVVTDLSRSKIEISLHKEQEHPFPVNMGQKEINYLWTSSLFWISLRDQRFEIFVSFNLNDIIDIDESEPVTFYYVLDEGRILGASLFNFSLPPSLQKKIETHVNAGTVATLESDPNKVLVTQVIPKFNLGIGIYGENSSVSSTWTALIYQFMGLSLIAVAVGLLLGYYFVSLVTKRLELLETKSAQIGAGDFNIILRDDSSDEVGSLAKTLNKMVGQIKQLFQEQQKQLRMESELKIAQTVQGTLFPPDHLHLQDYQLSGFYRSASECGGDLWGVWETEKYLNFYILDATGHGVSAALITSAARAMAAFFETQPDLTIEQISNGFNYAINKVGNNLHQATAFVCKLEKATGSLEYVNASHVSGYLIPEGVTAATKVKEIQFLSEPIINRFGQTPDIQIEKGQANLRSGDILLLVTDGLFDLATSDGKEFNERKVVKKFIELVAEHTSAGVSEILPMFIQFAFKENGDAELKDDVTLIALKKA